MSFRFKFRPARSVSALNLSLAKSPASSKYDPILGIISLIIKPHKSATISSIVFGVNGTSFPLLLGWKQSLKASLTHVQY